AALCRGACVCPPALAAALAAVARLPRGAGARGLVERDPDRVPVPQGEGRSRIEGGLLVAGDLVPACSPVAVLPGRGGRHRRALARRLPGRGADTARSRRLPPERLPAEQAALRRPRPRDLPELAPEPRRPLRRPHGGAAGLQRGRRGGAAPQWPLPPAARVARERRERPRGRGRRRQTRLRHELTGPNWVARRCACWFSPGGWGFGTVPIATARRVPIL